MMRSDKGQAGIALIIVIAWALAAVLMLTVTLVTAQQIQDRVKSITNSVGNVKGDTALVSILTQVNASASGILAAAAPLEPKLVDVDTAAKSIDSSVKSILSTAQSINSVVVIINGQAKSILSVVDSIAGTPGGGFGLGVHDINTRAAKADGILRTVLVDTASIRADVSHGAGPSGIHGHLCKVESLGGLGSLLPNLGLPVLSAVGQDGHC